MGWTIGVLGFDSRRGLGIFLFITAARTSLGPTQPPIQWVPGALSVGVKRPEREDDQWPPSSAEVKNSWSYTTLQYVFMAWCLGKNRDNFTFTLPVRVNTWLILRVSTRTICRCDRKENGKTKWRAYHACNTPFSSSIQYIISNAHKNLAGKTWTKENNLEPLRRQEDNITIYFLNGE
jgi:hypothetical protein